MRDEKSFPGAVVEESMVVWLVRCFIFFVRMGDDCMRFNVLGGAGRDGRRPETMLFGKSGH